VPAPEKMTGANFLLFFNAENGKNRVKIEIKVIKLWKNI